MKIYLAGKMSGLNKIERTRWRQNVQQYFYTRSMNHIKVISPCDFYDIDTVDLHLITEKEIKLFDLGQVRTSNVILVNLTYPDSIGTAMELMLAEELHIPIIAFGVVASNPVHPWITESVTKFCDTYQEACDYITKYYI